MIPDTYCYVVGIGPTITFFVFAYSRNDVDTYMAKQYPNQAYSIDQWFLVYPGFIFEYHQ